MKMTRRFALLLALCCLILFSGCALREAEEPLTGGPARLYYNGRIGVVVLDGVTLGEVLDGVRTFMDFSAELPPRIRCV